MMIMQTKRACARMAVRLGALAVVMTVLALSASQASAAGVKPLTLINGWTTSQSSTRTPAVKVVNGIVHLEGAIANGTTDEPFVLPSAYRPAAAVYVNADLCGSTQGRLIIESTGDVFVEAYTSFANAQCFTSLEGISYPLKAKGAKPLTLVNGWQIAPDANRTPAVSLVDGVVHLQGAIETGGTNTVPFFLPKADRPNKMVYVPVDMCDGDTGRLEISPNGEVVVRPFDAFSQAGCFTSLEGATYDLKSAKATPLTLQHGWAPYSASTRVPALTKTDGVIHLQGAMATTGSSTMPFTVPAGLRPSANVYIPIDLCLANPGRLIIEPSGTVVVDEMGSFSNAQCFTSLEGVNYPLN
jgi:hypothetical protein